VQRTIVRSSRGARNDGRRSESSCSRNSSSRTERLAALIRRPGPCRSALKAGLRITLHSDYNVTPVVPLEFTWTAVTRVMRDGGEVLNPDERITVQQALKAVTLDAAWQCRKNDITGGIEPGKCADFAVLENDPTAVHPTSSR
jgi:predicted amidohydrolase YtcJ